MTALALCLAMLALGAPPKAEGSKVQGVDSTATPAATPTAAPAPPASNPAKYPAGSPPGKGEPDPELLRKLELLENLELLRNLELFEQPPAGKG